MSLSDRAAMSWPGWTKPHFVREEGELDAVAEVEFGEDPARDRS
jgi:hypothetical protein